MAKIVLDGRAGVLVGELAERCRLSGVPLMLAVPNKKSFENKVVGPLWMKRHPVLLGRCRFWKLDAKGNGNKVSIRIAKVVGSGDVVVTSYPLLAKRAISRGAVAFHPNGWKYTTEFIQDLMTERRKTRSQDKLESSCRALLGSRPYLWLGKGHSSRCP